MMFVTRGLFSTSRATATQERVFLVFIHVVMVIALGFSKKSIWTTSLREVALDYGSSSVRSHSYLFAIDVLMHACAVRDESQRMM